MTKLLLSLFLCFQFASSGLAHRSNLPPSPPPKPAQQKPTPQPTPPPSEPDEVDVVKITTNLVQIDAVVTDRKGTHVTDLRADEVEMLENGKPQKITDFSYIRIARPTDNAGSKPSGASGPSAPVLPRKLQREDVRRTVALVIDDLRMSFDSIRFTKQTLKKFLDEQVGPVTDALYQKVLRYAKLDKSTGKPNLTIQARLFRNGELVFTGNEIPFALRDHTDPKRLGGGGAIQLGTEMKPGEYVLQIVVTDLLAKEKHRVATQWMDFEIVQ